MVESRARWFRQSQQLGAQWPYDYGVVPMFYDQYRWTIAEMLEGLRPLSAVVNLSPHCKVIAPFSYNRLNGIIAYPELQAALTALLKASAGVVPLIPVGTTVEDPSPPPPPPPPPPRDPALALPMKDIMQP